MIEKIKDFIKNVKYGFKSLYLWLPIIWKDRNWDHYYILKVLQHKINLTKNYIDKNKRYTGYEKDVFKMKICTLLLERLIRDEYDINATIPHLKKWGEGEFDIEDGILLVNYPNVKNEEDEKKQQKELRMLMKKSIDQQKQDLEYLCKMIRKHILQWWD